MPDPVPLPSIVEATIVAHGLHVRAELAAFQPRGTVIAINFAAYLLPCDWWVAMDGLGYYDLTRLPARPALVISTRKQSRRTPAVLPIVAVEAHGLPGVTWSLQRAIEMAAIAGARQLWIVGDDRIPGAGCPEVARKDSSWSKSYMKSMGGDVDRTIAGLIRQGLAIHRVDWRDGQVEVHDA